jgi:hypothetical protein
MQAVCKTEGDVAGGGDGGGGGGGGGGGVQIRSPCLHTK